MRRTLSSTPRTMFVENISFQCKLKHHFTKQRWSQLYLYCSTTACKSDQRCIGYWSAESSVQHKEECRDEEKFTSFLEELYRCSVYVKLVERKEPSQKNGQRTKKPRCVDKQSWTEVFSYFLFKQSNENRRWRALNYVSNTTHLTLKRASTGDKYAGQPEWFGPILLCQHDPRVNTQHIQVFSPDLTSHPAIPASSISASNKQTP